MTTWWVLGLFVLLLTGASACQRATYQYQPLPPSAAATSEATPQLLFLSFNMTTTPAGGHYLESLLMKTVAGQANPVADDIETGPSYLLISQLDAANTPCGPARRIPHPLVQDVEAPTAAGTGVLERHIATLTQAEFFVRLARLPKARAVRLEEVGPAAPNPITVIFSLPN